MDHPYSKFKKIYEFLENERRKREQTENVAADIMTKQIYSIDSNSTMKDAMKIMNKYSIIGTFVCTVTTKFISVGFPDQIRQTYNNCYQHQDINYILVFHLYNTILLYFFQ